MNSVKHRVNQILLVIIALYLSACGSEPQTQIQPTLSPLLPRPTANALAAANNNNTSSVAAITVNNVEIQGRLLFVQNGNIWQWQNDKATAITQSNNTYQPAFSPDGQQIAYIYRTESASDLMVMPANGGESQQLTNDGTNSSLYSYDRIYNSLWALYPTWAPHGNEIAFTSQAGPPYGSPAAEYRLSIFVTPSNVAGARQQIYAEGTGHVGQLAYSPDGNSITFEFANNTDPVSLYNYNRQGGSVVSLGLPSPSYDPNYSPDGNWLAFSSRSPQGTDIFIVPSNGGTPKQLTSLGNARAATFSPDGNHLAFLAMAPGHHSFDLWIAQISQASDGSLQLETPRQITKDLSIDADSGLSWAP